MLKNYFILKDNHNNTPEELAEMSKIYTMSVIKRLLARADERGYNLYLDMLRRTFYQCISAEQGAELANALEELEKNRAELLDKFEDDAEELEELKEQLANILLDSARREELDAEYFDKKHRHQQTERELDALREDIRTVSAVKVETSTDLADLFNVWVVGYLEAEPTEEELDEMRDKLTGAAKPTEQQKQNRAELDEMTEEEQRASIAHLCKVKSGQRAVNRHIRAQANKTADFSKKSVSYERITTRKDEDGNTKIVEVKIARTTNRIVEAEADMARIKALAKHANLTKTERAFLNQFCTLGALMAEQKARNQYHAEQFDKMMKKGEMRKFGNRISRTGYEARKAYAMNQVKPLREKTDEAKRQFFSRLLKKLKPIAIRAKQNIGEPPTAEPDKYTEEERTKRRTKAEKNRKQMKAGADLLTFTEGKRGTIRTGLKAYTAEELEQAEQVKAELTAKIWAESEIAEPTAEAVEQAQAEQAQAERIQAERIQAQTVAELEEAKRDTKSKKAKAEPTANAKYHRIKYELILKDLELPQEQQTAPSADHAELVNRYKAQPKKATPNTGAKFYK